MPQTIFPAVVVGGALFGLSIAERRLHARWSTAPDPLKGVAPRFPEGDFRPIKTDDDATIATIDAGTGPAIVLVHGLTSNADDWGPIAEDLLVAGFRVIAIEQRGHGSSTVGADGFGIARQARDLAIVLEELDLHDVVMVGHSMGGMATMAMALDFPAIVDQRIRGLGLIATSASLRGGYRKRALQIGSHPLTTHTDRFDKRALTVAGLGVFGPNPSMFMVEQAVASANRCPAEVRQGATAGLIEYDITDRLPYLDIPTLSICGTDDRLTPIEDNRAIASMIRGTHLEEIPGAGHLVIWERYRTVSTLITQFAHIHLGALSPLNS